MPWCVAALLMLGGVMLHQSPWDQALFLAINTGLQHWDGAGSALSVLGLATAALVLAGLVGVRQPQVLASVLITVLAGGTLVQTLKSVLATARPLAVLGADAVHVVGAALHTRSMPSGHTAMWAALATLLWLAPRSRWWPRRQWTATWAFSLLAVAGGLSRVVVGAHWPADVLVGAGLGVAMGSLVGGTPAGHRYSRSLAAVCSGRVGACLVAWLMAGLAISLWWSAPTDHAALACHVLLGLLGLVAAGGWWRLHPGPIRPLPVLVQRTDQSSP